MKDVFMESSVEICFKRAQEFADKNEIEVTFVHNKIKCSAFPSSENSDWKNGVKMYKELSKLKGLSWNIEKDMRFVACTIYNEKNIQELLEFCKLSKDYCKLQA